MSTIFNPSSNPLLDSILGGEITGNMDISRIQRTLEDRFIESHEYYDYQLPPDVLSTIAIAISCDGYLVATTHGDHTVKIFWFSDGKLHRIFRGHPRTPWTVKFHATDSNLLASGCLGCEVRVWDIRQNACISLSRYDYSIISLAFHPDGDIIGIATGPQLHMWRWKENVMSQYAQKYRPVYDTQPKALRPLTHSRNIRAVIFHPGKTHIFAAAPDSPRQQQPAFTPCRLYAFTFDDISDSQSISSSWSDDEDTLGSFGGNNNNNSSDTRESTPSSGRRSQNTHPEIRGNIPPPPPLASPPSLELCLMPVLIPQVHLYSDGGIDLSSDGLYLFTCARLLRPPPNYNTAKITPHPLSLHTIPFCASPSSPKDVLDQHRMVTQRESSSISSNSNSSSNITTFANKLENTTTSVVPPRGKKQQQQKPSSNKNNLQYINLKSKIIRNSSEFFLYDSKRKLLDVYDQNETSSPHNKIQQQQQEEEEEEEEEEELVYRFADPRNEIIEREYPDWEFEDHLSLFRLDSNMVPKLARSLKLSGSLVKAVTSTKLSPTGRYALIGYGVRANGKVEDHPHNQVACEMVNLARMKTVTVMTDSEDEVNIAQFHPISGMGVLYGTKKGKVRKFKKS